MALPGVAGIIRALQERRRGAAVDRVQAYSGLRVYAGSIMMDYNPDCRGVRWFETVDKMRNYSRVQAAEHLMILPVQYANPRFEPPSSARSAASREAAELLTKNLFEDCKTEFVDLIRWALLARLYGVRVIVPQWGIRDGLTVVEEFVDLLPTTYYGWRFENQQPVALVQQAMDPDTGQTVQVEIPLEYAIRFTWREEGGNPEGRSDARAAYGHWFTVTFIESVVRVAVERAGVGAWRGTVSRDLWENRTLREEVKNILKALRSHQEGAVVLPESVQIDVIAAVEKQGVSVLTDVWDRFIREMTNALFASIFNVGMTDLGTSAWAEQLLRLSIVSLNSSARWLAQNINNQLVRRWMAYNYPNLPPSEHPNLVFDDVMLVLAPGTLLDAWNQAVQAGNLPTGDRELQRHMAKVLGLPEPAEAREERVSQAEPMREDVITLASKPSEASFERAMRDFLEKVTERAQRDIAGMIDEVRQSPPMQRGLAVAKLQSLELLGQGQYEQLLRDWLWRFFTSAQERIARDLGGSREVPNAMRQWINVKAATLARDHYETLRARLIYEALDMALGQMPLSGVQQVVANSVREQVSASLTRDLKGAADQMLRALNESLREV